MFREDHLSMLVLYDKNRDTGSLSVTGFCPTIRASDGIEMSSTAHRSYICGITKLTM